MTANTDLRALSAALARLSNTTGAYSNMRPPVLISEAKEGNQNVRPEIYFLSFSFLNYQFALALWDKLACLLNQTCPVAAQGGSGTGVSVSVHSSPPIFHSNSSGATHSSEGGHR